MDSKPLHEETGRRAARFGAVWGLMVMSVGQYEDNYGISVSFDPIVKRR